jgi:quercetin dioxygenase-like cupin family protein
MAEEHPMRRWGVGVTVALGVALAVAAGGQAGSGGFTELHRAEIQGTQVVMGLIERNGGSQGARHIHPGGEFGFILEGSITLVTEDEPTVTLEEGSSFHLSPGKWHSVATSSSGARTVVFRVLEPGQPRVVPIE